MGEKTTKRGSTRPPLGAHVSVAGGVAKAIGRGEDLGCTAIQIFVKNANRWHGKPIAEDDAAAFRAGREASPIGPAVAHASYLINLGATDETVLARSKAALADELARCAQVGVDALVLHPGAHLGTGEDAGIDRIAAVLDPILAAAPPGPRLLLENTAGQGTTLGWRLEHLEAILARLEHAPRVGVCLDTCHAFAAGYPVHEEPGYAEFWSEVDARLGFDGVGCLHLNDSLKPFASRRDRHAHIGEGEIGLDLFARLLHDPRLAAVPMVIETETGDDLEGHRKDLEVLRGL
jgi:deoxyribonuclease-4